MPTIELADQLLVLASDSIRYLWMPIGIWTLLVGVYLIIDRFTPNNRPILKYQAATALLWSLPLGIVLAIILPLSIEAPESMKLVSEATSTGSPAPSVARESASPHFEWTFQHGVGLLTVLLLGIGLMNIARLTFDAAGIYSTARSLKGEPLSEIDEKADRVRKAWKIKRPIRVVFSDKDLVPMTFGWRKPVIVIPDTLRESATDLHMTLLHELSHIRHRDYLRRITERIIQGVFSFHPFTGYLTRQIDQLREMACDNEVLQQTGVAARQYATLLLQFAIPTAPQTHLAISMADSKTNLKKRITAMKDYRFLSQGALNSTTIGFALFALLLAVSALAVACEVKFVEDNSITINEVPAEELNAEESLTEDANGSAETDGEVFMIVENMPELIGGLAAIQKNIKYPTIAKRAGIEGRVFVQFVVDENGNVQSPKVVKGIGGGCDEEAIRAVSLAKFKPGMQRGKTVKVKMSIPITFKLSDSNDAEKLQELSHMLELLQKKSAEMKEQAANVSGEESLQVKEQLQAIKERIDQIKEHQKELEKAVAESRR